jgi:hypothetical protein
MRWQPRITTIAEWTPYPLTNLIQLLLLERRGETDEQRKQLPWQTQAITLRRSNGIEEDDKVRKILHEKPVSLGEINTYRILVKKPKER